MRWLKRDLWKVGIALAGLLFFLVFMLWVPLSVADAYEGTPELITPTPTTLQPTPTVDATVTALNKEQLTLQVKQLQNQLQNQNNWVANNSTALIAAVATVVVALFGIFQWAITVRQAQSKDLRDRADERQKEIAMQDKESKDRQAAQDKDLRAQAEERFKTAVAALGDEKESTQVGGAILLRSFLHKDDEEIYGRYYTQIFDLAVAYLRPSSTSQPSGDTDVPLPLTTLSQALIVAFRESFPLARDRMKERRSQFNPQSLDASYIQLDRANLNLADMEQIWMPAASLREANFYRANLSGANLANANFSGANLMQAKLNNKTGLYGANLFSAKLIDAELIEAFLYAANLSHALLSGGNFSKAALRKANLEEADLGKANLSQADLGEADLSRAFLLGADLSEASLNQTNLSGANLSYANLRKIFLTDANLSGANLSNVKSLDTATGLERTDLRGVTGLTREQLEACKAKGAIIDEAPTTSPHQPTVSPPPPSQSSGTQTSPAAPAQANTPTHDTGGSNTTSSKSSLGT